MRLLIVVHGYPPTHMAGAELRAQRTARGLVARGADVRVLCVESAHAAGEGVRHEDRVEDGVWIRRLYLDINAGPSPFLWSYDNPIIGAATAQILDEWRPTVVHLYSGYLMSSSVIREANSRGTPTVLSLTDYWWICHRITLIRTNGTRCDGPSPEGCGGCFRERRRRHRVASKLWPRGTEMLWRMSDALHGPQSELERQRQRATALKQVLEEITVMVAPSQYLADKYIEHGVDPDRIRVWRQGVDVHCIPPVPSRALRVGYLGQIKYHKGVHTLLEAWSKLRGTQPRRLELFGTADGESAYGRQLSEAIEQLSDATWNGHFESPRLWSVLANLDVIVVPSRWAENSPNVILEAQAVNIPVVGTRLGGIPELVAHDRNGLLFTVDDADDLARQLQRLLDEPGLLGRLSAKAVAVNSVEEELNQLWELYGSLADTPLTARPRIVQLPLVGLTRTQPHG